MTNHWERGPDRPPEPEEFSLPVATRLVWGMAGLMFLAGVLDYTLLSYTAGFILLCLAWVAAVCCAVIWAYAVSMRFTRMAAGFVAVLVLVGASLFLARTVVYHAWADEVRCTVVATSSWKETYKAPGRKWNGRIRGGASRAVHEVEWVCGGEHVKVTKPGNSPLEKGESYDMAYDPERRVPFERAGKVLALWKPGLTGVAALGVLMYLGGYLRRPAWTRMDKA
ncbi:hypothetical protein O4J56_07975 [Nocardiopsis sp. RSe5-2]|uniref:DUF3592 domain-containing protein n=1 Tax=Nocardiopsis endophytica TaxID=3018445 RepID=A0ABT4U0W0_9ACTN|nr:hypothetical protein [Nocardiopsis endophytica]MDA2810570.1 hypothetical protein [Nocardiopsis endophytica]